MARATFPFRPYPDPTPALAEHDLYLGDNGRCFCGSAQCAGSTAYYTGHDLSGQRLLRVTPAMARRERWTPRCEGCGRALEAGS